MESRGIAVRLLTATDAGDYFQLRREALRDSPLAFAASPDDDFASSIEAVREQLSGGPERVAFGAFSPDLVGIISLVRDRHLKAAHKAHLFGMYVTPAMRGKKAGRRLVEASIRHARSLAGVSQLHLSVTDAAPEARRLYEALGFAAWGTEPASLRYGDRTVAEHHMLLVLTEHA